MDPLEIIAEADKKAKPASGFSSFFGGSSSSRYEEAGDLYTQAANQYKVQKNVLQAGKIFEKATEAYMKANSPDDAAGSLVEAYKAYKQPSPSDAARCLSKAIEHFTSRGQFRRCAGYKCELAELYLALNEKENAIMSLQDAGDWYLSDSAVNLSNKCFLQSADLKADLGQYLEASEVYESIAEKALENNLSRWSAGGYFVKAVLCRLAASDYVGAVNKLELFVSWDREFTQSKEYKFLSELLDAVKERDPDLFGKACSDYDRLTKLDNWKVRILTKIKDSLSGEGGGAAGDLEEDDLT